MVGIGAVELPGQVESEAAGSNPRLRYQLGLTCSTVQLVGILIVATNKTYQNAIRGI
jgi:hypothetical protein